MTIVTHLNNVWPQGQYKYLAIDDDTYDGAEDSATRNMIGFGQSPELARLDLLRLMQEEAEANGEVDHEHE